MLSMTISRKSRAIGMMLGIACGDALGSNLEFLTRQQIQDRHGLVRDFLHSSRHALGDTTDDTQAALAVAISLTESGGVNGSHHAAVMVRLQKESSKSFGPGTTKILSRLASGEPWDMVNGQSYGNGAILKSMPIGVVCVDRDASEKTAMVREILLPTHGHVDAIDSGAVACDMVSRLFLGDSLYSVIVSFLRSKRDGRLGGCVSSVIDAMPYGHSVEKFLDSVCTPNEWGRHFQIHSAEALSCSLWCLIKHPGNPEEAIIEAANLGGDSDSVAAITGGFCGAAFGESWLPKRWLDNLRNVDYLAVVGAKLAKGPFIC